MMDLQRMMHLQSKIEDGRASDEEIEEYLEMRKELLEACNRMVEEFARAFNETLSPAIRDLSKSISDMDLPPYE